MMRVAAAAMMLAGCTATAQVAPAPSPALADAGCEPGPLKDLIGTAAGEAAGADALRRSGARTMRWVGPDTAVTMDFRPDRLNVLLDGTNRITGFRCG